MKFVVLGVRFIRVILVFGIEFTRVHCSVRCRVGGIGIVLLFFIDWLLVVIVGFCFIFMLS